MTYAKGTRNKVVVIGVKIISSFLILKLVINYLLYWWYSCMYSYIVEVSLQCVCNYQDGACLAPLN